MMTMLIQGRSAALLRRHLPEVPDLHLLLVRSLSAVDKRRRIDVAEVVHLLNFLLWICEAEASLP